MHVAAGAALEWLPQETILFDGCALDRRLEVDLATGARFLGIETLLFGRTSMGETVHRAQLRDTIRISRAGSLLWHDAIRLEDTVQAVLNRPAVAAGGRAVATLVLASPRGGGVARPTSFGAGAVRRGGRRCCTSCWSRASWRQMGPVQRAAIVAGLAALRGGRALPRVWSC